MSTKIELPPEIIAEQRKAALARQAQLTPEGRREMGRKGWLARLAKYQTPPVNRPHQRTPVVARCTHY